MYEYTQHASMNMNMNLLNRNGLLRGFSPKAAAKRKGKNADEGAAGTRFQGF